MAALFKLYLFIWTMLSYNWVDRNLYSVAYNKNPESIDSEELEDYIYSRWHKKVPKPILKKTSGIVIKRDHTAFKNMPNRKHTPWVWLKSDVIRHNGDDDNYMLDGSSDSDEDDMSNEEEEEEEESVYNDHGVNGVNNHYNGEDLESSHLWEKIYKDIDKLTHKCSLPLNSQCLSTVFYRVFKNLRKHKKNEKDSTLESKEQNAVTHENPSSLKSLQQLLEDIFLKKYSSLSQSESKHQAETQKQNSPPSEEDTNKLLMKLITQIQEGDINISKKHPTDSNDNHIEMTTETPQPFVESSAEVSKENPGSVIPESTKSSWKRVKHNNLDSRSKHPVSKISFKKGKLNLDENTYLGLEYFYKLIGVLNDLNIDFTYSPDKKTIFINPESLLETRMHKNFLNIKNIGWQKRKPFKVRIDFHKNTANNSHIILKTGKNAKKESGSSEINIEFLQSEENITAKPTVINNQDKTSFTPQPQMTTMTTPPPTTTTETTINHSPMDVNINININHKHVNTSLTAGRKKDINITHHIDTDPHNEDTDTVPTATPTTHLGEWTVWYKWSPCSISCGIGHRKRHRLCLPPGYYCPGNHSEKASCLKGQCSLETTTTTITTPAGHLTAWNNWSKCSTTCGIGQKSRQRQCLPKGSHCNGNVTKIISCTIIHCDAVTTTKLPPPPTTTTTTTPTTTTEKEKPIVKIMIPTGHWTIWHEWTHCSTSCGLGIRKRSRECLPYGFHCKGDLIDMASCMLQTCDSAKITTAIRKPKTRKPTTTEKTKTIPPPPKAKSSIVFQLGEWKAWHDWSPCSVSCGYGIQHRDRICLHSHCIGFTTETMHCMERPCVSEWATWNEWSTCSVTCGNGHRSRNHICLPHGSLCTGVVKEIGPCVQPVCIHEQHPIPVVESVDGQWSSWTEWSNCSVKCGTGQRFRHRACHTNGIFCVGHNTDTETCALGSCFLGLTFKNTGHWTSWSDWSHCSSLCNKGYRKRFRSCLPKGSECRGVNTVAKACMIDRCQKGLSNKIHRSWTSWSEWSHCSTTCDSGQKKRFRSCLPKGSKCNGDDTEETECTSKLCLAGLPNKTSTSWTSWSEWSHCSTTCDSGQKKRFRVCIPKGSVCRGNTTDVEKCMHKPCHEELSNETHSSWTSWSEWSHCSTTCDTGQRKRFRSCLPKGTKCNGDDTEDTECIHKPCDTELPNTTLSSWTSWSEWSHCSAPCDSGQKKRFRSCLPKGTECDGDDIEEKECKRKPCLTGLSNNTHSSWTSWSEWSHCSASCGSGQKKRFRSCLPKGTECNGDDIEDKECKRKLCLAVLPNNTHSSWTSWSEWSHCSATCGSGQKKRFRSCLPKGTECNGDDIEKKECKRKPCLAVLPNNTHSSWTSWSEWSYCSTTCDSGQKKRFRRCVPKDTRCNGDDIEKKECMRKPCLRGKSAGRWSQWTPWSNCSVSCGRGSQKRRRRCESVDVECAGDAIDEELCIGRSCFPGQWGKWNSWSQCSAPCGRGRITRNRTCVPNGAQCSGKYTEHTVCMKRSCNKENVRKSTTVLQGKFTKLKCCSQSDCHRSKYKWLTPYGKLIIPSNNSENRFFAVNEFLIIEKTQKKDKGTYRCLKISGNSAKGIELPLRVQTCENKPCLNNGVCKDTLFSPKQLYKTVCRCQPGYFGSICQIDKTSPFTRDLAKILTAIVIILICAILVLLIVYICFRRGKLKRCFDSKTNVLLEFNHDNTFNSSDSKPMFPDHSGLRKSQFFSPECFYPESIIRTTTIDTTAEEKECDIGQIRTSTPS